MALRTDTIGDWLILRSHRSKMRLSPSVLREVTILNPDSAQPEHPDAPPSDAGPSPLRSVHTTNFPAILEQLQSSLLVTTYQAGKLVVVRADGGVINTHFRAFNKPMGMAVGRDRLAIGTATDVWEFRNVPAVTAKLDPPGKH